MNIALLRDIGLGEVLVVLLIILLLFGAKRVPDLARSLGRSLGEFRKGREEGASNSAKQSPDEGSKGSDTSSQ